MVATLTFLPFQLSGSIAALTALDFLGLGLPPGSPSLGELLLQGKRHLEAPWLGLTGFFSVAVMLSLLIFEIPQALRMSALMRMLPRLPSSCGFGDSAAGGASAGGGVGAWGSGFGSEPQPMATSEHVTMNKTCCAIFMKPPLVALNNSLKLRDEYSPKALPGTPLTSKRCRHQRTPVGLHSCPTPSDGFYRVARPVFQ
jgi:hypothetical protein